MKRSIFSLPAIAASISFCFLLMSTSCKKSSSGGSSGTLTGSISGTSFQPSHVDGEDVFAILQIGGVQVKAGDSTALVIDFPDTSPINTALNLTQSEIIYDDAKGNFDFDSENSPSHGTITITSWDKTGLKIAGTFSGVIYGDSNDSIVITNGTFNTTYKQF